MPVIQFIYLFLFKIKNIFNICLKYNLLQTDAPSLSYVYSQKVSSDVDGVGVFLAQRFVFLGEECLTLQVSRAHL